jgi:hypothetical protein
MNKNSILVNLMLTIGILGLLASSAVAATWKNEILDSAGEVGGHSSIAIDSAGNVHISYYDAYPNYDLKYATNASGSWVAMTVDSNDVGLASSIVDFPRIDGHDEEL